MTFIQNKGILKPPISRATDTISQFSTKYPLVQHNKVLSIASENLAAPVVGKAQCHEDKSTSKHNFAG